MLLQEGATPHDDNMQYVNLAVRACTQRQTICCHRRLRDTQMKRDSSGQIRKNGDPLRDPAPFAVPFGPHLISVCVNQQAGSPEISRMTPEDLKFKSSADGVSEVSSNAELKTEPTSAYRLGHGTDEHPSGFTHTRECDCADETSAEPRHTTITTNDLLDCLVHPDIINRVTQLLLERHPGSLRDTTQSSL